MVIIKKLITRLFVIVIIILIVIGLGAVTLNSIIQNNQKDNILCKINENKNTLDDSEVDALLEFKGDCILVLGAGIIDKDTPTPMLKDRLDTGIMLYNLGVAPKLLLSGDNGSQTHNEIHVMLKYCLDAGVPSEDIFCDHAGFSTYDSMYRAKEIFQVKNAIVVTQTYHEYRALYIGEKIGLNVIGVASDQKKYVGQALREIREVLARDKDFFKVIVKAKPMYGGDTIPISGDGNSSHGE